MRAEVHRYSEQTRRNNSTLYITRVGFSDQFSDYIESLLLFSLWKSRNGSLVWGGRHRENDDRHMSTPVCSRRYVWAFFLVLYQPPTAVRTYVCSEIGSRQAFAAERLSPHLPSLQTISCIL